MGASVSQVSSSKQPHAAAYYGCSSELLPGATGNPFDRFSGTTIFPPVNGAGLLTQQSQFYQPALNLVENSTDYVLDKRRHQRLEVGGRQFYGQHAEDCALHALLHVTGLMGGHGRDRFFLEMGALNGITYSNTLALEHQGWKGLLIEANPDNCHHLKENRRSGCTVNVCAGICNAGGGPLEFERGRSGATARMVLTKAKTKVEQATRFPAPCLPLSQVLIELKIPRINVFSLDVEGAERFVLKTFDFDAVPIDIINWEGRITDGPGTSSYDVNKMLSSHGMVQLLGKNFGDNVHVSKKMHKRLQHVLNTSSVTVKGVVNAASRMVPGFGCPRVPFG